MNEAAAEAAKLRAVLERIACDQLASAEELRNLAGMTLENVPVAPLAPGANLHVQAALDVLAESINEITDLPYDETSHIFAHNVAAYNNLAATLTYSTLRCPLCHEAAYDCGCTYRPADVIQHNLAEIADLVPDDFGTARGRRAGC